MNWKKKFDNLKSKPQKEDATSKEKLQNLKDDISQLTKLRDESKVHISKLFNQIQQKDEKIK